MEYNIYSINEAIYNLIELHDNATILDIGCRNAGYLKDILEKFPDKVEKAIGIDITDKHFDEVEYKVPIELIVMNCADGLDFEDNEFDNPLGISTGAATTVSDVANCSFSELYSSSVIR